ncbi:hypothetical protein K469DRAFT_810273 [Zopfia rhizophila CBS 207.26]|uniref:Uncharacterized protein n=1 Tax=Zopfia rhizophila CBS 207.26 TaxID=1314779 RepID=A0A6A6D4D7_9PEZI|nr:hypothetical protein K469DRAFT_810273 [Zopfia rhizophila CBS 207.26]
MGGPEISGQEHQLQNGREAFNPTTSGPKQRNNDVKKHKKNKLDSRKYPLRNSGGAYDRKISGQKSQYDYEEEDGSTKKKKTGDDTEHLAMSEDGLKMQLLRWKADSNARIWYLVQYSSLIGDIKSPAHALIPQSDIPPELTQMFPRNTKTDLANYENQRAWTGDSPRCIRSIAWPSSHGICRMPLCWNFLSDYLRYGNDEAHAICNSAVKDVVIEIEWPDESRTWEEPKHLSSLIAISDLCQAARGNEERYYYLVQESWSGALQQMRRI